MTMMRRFPGKALGLALIAGGLTVGLPGCAPLDVGPEVVLEAIPTSAPMGKPIDFYVSARARASSKIVVWTVFFGDGTEFKSEPMAVVSIERQKITHTYTLPEGVDVMTFVASLWVHDSAGNSGRDAVEITVGRGQP